MKNEIELIENKEIDNLYNDIKLLVEQSRNKVYKTVNTEMINLYWNIGKMIVELQKGEEKAKYDDYLIERISIKLTSEFGKGFHTRNIKRMRNFYLPMKCIKEKLTIMTQVWKIGICIQLLDMEFPPIKYL